MSGSRYITSPKGLKPYRGKAVKYSTDKGRTWCYALLENKGPTEFYPEGLGYTAFCEVTKGVHARISFTMYQFAVKGLLVLPATPTEVADKYWSYSR